MKMISLDTVDRIYLAKANDGPYTNVLGAIHRQHLALEQLYVVVKKAETERKEAEQAAGRVTWSMASPVLANGVPAESMFCWYAVTASSIIAMVNAIASRAQLAGHTPDYIERVGGRMLMYRNKVAAHRVWTDPRKKGNTADNDVDEALSLLPTVSWRNGRLCAHNYDLIRVSGGVETRARNSYLWSLTDYQETVIDPRYNAIPMKPA